MDQRQEFNEIIDLLLRLGIFTGDKIKVQMSDEFSEWVKERVEDNIASLKDVQTVSDFREYLMQPIIASLFNVLHNTGQFLSRDQIVKSIKCLMAYYFETPLYKKSERELVSTGVLKP